MRHYALPALVVLMAAICVYQNATVGAAGWLVVGVLEIFINPRSPS